MNTYQELFGEEPKQHQYHSFETSNDGDRIVFALCAVADEIRALRKFQELREKNRKADARATQTTMKQLLTLHSNYTESVPLSVPTPNPIRVCVCGHPASSHDNRGCLICNECERRP